MTAGCRHSLGWWSAARPQANGSHASGLVGKVARVLSRCGSEILWSADESSALKGWWMATTAQIALPLPRATRDSTGANVVPWARPVLATRCGLGGPRSGLHNSTAPHSITPSLHHSTAPAPPRRHAAGLTGSAACPAAPRPGSPDPAPLSACSFPHSSGSSRSGSQQW